MIRREFGAGTVSIKRYCPLHKFRNEEHQMPAHRNSDILQPVIKVRVSSAGNTKTEKKKGERPGCPKTARCI